jgi:lipopolysaccharide transport system ATP-binding protein
MKPILELTNVSKKYQLRHLSGGYLTLRERMLNLLRFDSAQAEDFWALKEVSFKVDRGDSLGIIGRNGAGKSTLLKILSKVTPPTSGRIVTRGRFGSLLEVGTGFHPELSGRENIFFNGSLLGMKRREIQRRFDEIVDFSGTERFLDTPLKHFSSGMQLRLAFSVSAFLEPELLLIDEVLAVGDAEFQKKCIEKMESVRSSGRTILFVSHDLEAVERLCKKSILLSRGQIVNSGLSAEVIAQYLSDSGEPVFHPVNLTSNVRLEQLEVSPSSVESGESVNLKIGLSHNLEQDIEMSDLCLLFYNYRKQRVAIYDMRNYFPQFTTTPGRITFEGLIRRFNLVEGVYTIGVYYGFNSQSGDVYDLVSIKVKGEADHRKVVPYHVQYRGFVELN